MTTAERTTIAAPAEAPPGYWQREASHNPKPLTPFGSSFFMAGVNQSFPKVFADFGLLVETFSWREIGGYVYTSVIPFGVGNAGGGGLPPKWVLWSVLRLHPAFRRRLARCKEAVRSGLDRQLIDRWYDKDRPRLIADIARLRAVDLAALSDDALAAHLEELRRWSFEAFDVHFYLSAANGFPIYRLAKFCEKHLAYDDMASLRLLSGLSGASSEPALELARLAGRVRRDHELAAAVIAAPPHAVADVLREHDPEAGAELDRYVDEYGYRALRYEVIEPTLGEQPDHIGRLLQDQLQRPVDLESEQQQLAAERAQAKGAALAALPDEAARHEFQQLLAVAERAYPVREDNEFFTISVPLALIRFAALEAGRRLIGHGRISAAEDVFFLTVDETIGALRNRDALAGLVAERRQQLAEAETFDPPASYGAEPPQPPLDVLPPEAREAMEAMLYLTEKIFEAEQSGERASAGTREIHGRPAARGEYTGDACVIMGEHEFDKLQPGDVLVCPITSPVWSILFAKVGALVTDSGGILSHPAIIAREYGIPAVVATGNATSLIRDGQRVTVRGDAGTVTLLD